MNHRIGPPACTGYGIAQCTAGCIAACVAGFSWPDMHSAKLRQPPFSQTDCPPFCCLMNRLHHAAKRRTRRAPITGYSWLCTHLQQFSVEEQPTDMALTCALEHSRVLLWLMRSVHRFSSVFAVFLLAFLRHPSSYLTSHRLTAARRLRMHRKSRFCTGSRESSFEIIMLRSCDEVFIIDSFCFLHLHHQLHHSYKAQYQHCKQSPYRSTRRKGTAANAAPSAEETETTKAEQRKPSLVGYSTAWSGAPPQLASRIF